MTVHVQTREDAVRSLEAEFTDLFALVRGQFMARARQVHADLQPAEYKTFATIVRKGSVKHTALAEELLTDKGQISRTVRKLEDLGLVERAPDPDDGRASLISATADGQRRLAEARQTGADSMRKQLGDWPVADIERLTALLHALRTGEAPPHWVS